MSRSDRSGRVGTLLVERPAGGDGKGGGRRPEAQLAGTRRRRELPWVVLGVALAVACALGFAVVLSGAAGSRQVLVAAHDLAAGHVFEPGDLRVVNVSSDGVDLLSASPEDTVVGHTAAVPVAARAPLVSGDVGSADLGTGAAVVAVVCHPGQFPPSLAAGQRVRIVEDLGGTASSATGGSSSAVRSVDEGVVLAVDASSDAASTGTVITLRVTDADATDIAEAGGAGHVSLIVIGSGS